MSVVSESVEKPAGKYAVAVDRGKGDDYLVFSFVTYDQDCNCEGCRGVRDMISAHRERESLRKDNAELKACNDRQEQTIGEYIEAARRAQAERLELQAELNGRRSQAKAQEQVIRERDFAIEQLKADVAALRRYFKRRPDKTSAPKSDDCDAETRPTWREAIDYEYQAAGDGSLLPRRITRTIG